MVSWDKAPKNSRTRRSEEAKFETGKCVAPQLFTPP